jgi:hypothetical protein
MTRIRMPWWVWAGALLAVALVAGFTVWWRANYERVETVVDKPRSGEARSNPLYGLTLTLRADHVQVVDGSRPVWDERHSLADKDTVLVFSDSSLLSDVQAQRLLDWVERGGHLLMLAPLASPAESSLAGRLSIVTASAGGCMVLQGAGKESTNLFCGSRRFALQGGTPAALLDWQDTPKGDETHRSVYMRLAHGKGVVDVVSDFEFLTTDALKQPLKSDFTHRLLAPDDGAGTVYLVHDLTMPSFWGTLWRQYWMAWMPLLLVLLGWLWQRMQRFGPLLPAPNLERRSLLEHIDASGQHIYRYGYANRLYDAVRHAFLTRLRARDPQTAALNAPLQAAWLAERCGESASQIQEALEATAMPEPAQFRTRVALLIRLRNQLR